MATRAAVDRCGPGHVATPLSPTGTGRPGAGRERAELHGDDPEDPTPQPELFDLSDEGHGGVRPLTVAEPRPQERVLRHTAEQIGDVAPVVPALGVPEPQMVLQLVAVLKPVDSTVPEQVIAVPKISLPSRPLRAALAATQMVEQLVEVPADVVVLMETDTEDEEEEEEEEKERRTWIDDNDDAWALVVPRGRRPCWWNIRQHLSQWHPPWEPQPGQGAGAGLTYWISRLFWGCAMLGSTVDTYSASA